MTLEKTFDAATAEARIAAAWEAGHCFAAGANAKPGAESFCIVIPPPNVTGSLHMGHALNNSLQDVLIRWKRMQGFDTLWQPGQDHAGIATQMVVERKLAKEGKPGRREMGREKFLETVWAWKEESGDTIIGQLKRLGASCDWSRNRFTMDEGLSRAVLKVFVALYRKGLIYRAKRLVNWDPHFETAISDLEVEQIEVKGKFWRFRYPLADGVTYPHPIAFDEAGNATEFETRDYIVVATTRPETMLGDTGVAVHPQDARYAGLVGKSVVLPLVGRRIPIVADDYADKDKGTGAVKITPAHDFNDWGVGKRQNLAAINIMGRKGEIWLKDNADFHADSTPSLDALALDGLDRFVARKQLVALIEAAGALDGIEDNVHMVPHGDRSKVAIEPLMTDQWFVDAKTLAEPALAAVRDGSTAFVPKNWEKTYFQWLDNIEPWCISRQLWWGHQIPVWYDADGAPYCAETEAEAMAQAGGKTLTRDPDVLDTWFSSALWPFSTMGWPDATPELARYYKTDVLITGFDIIFFWVARMMMFGLFAMNEVPFHTVYVHALVRDEKGRKMSKSLGNVIDPLVLIDKYGADAVRFTLTAMAAQGRDIKLAESRVEGYRNFGTKLWNAARFAEMNGCVRVAGFDPNALSQTVNKWIVAEVVRGNATVDAALTSYRYNDAANALYGLVWGVFCDWYLELSKPLLNGSDEAAKAETRATMAWALDQMLHLLHPFMPFVTEELWEQTGARAASGKMLVHGNWPALGHLVLDPAADAEMGWVIALIEGVRSVRAALNVPAGAQVPMTLVGADDMARGRMARNEALIMRLARLSSVSHGNAPRGAVNVVVDGASAALSVAEFIDVAAEQARLGKTVEKTRKEADGIAGRLNNPGYLAKAPDEVVEENRERLTQLEAEIAKLTEALARLAEMG